MRIKEGEQFLLGAEFFYGDRVYLYWPLGSGKTTSTKYFIQEILKVKTSVTSPTYAYWRDCGEGVYHFDLYRLQDRAHFVRIGGEDVFDDYRSICFVEWPEKIEKDFPPTVAIHCAPVPDHPDLRDIVVHRLSYPPEKIPFRGIGIQKEDTQGVQS